MLLDILESSFAASLSKFSGYSLSKEFWTEEIPFQLIGEKLNATGFSKFGSYSKKELIDSKQHLLDKHKLIISLRQRNFPWQLIDSTTHPLSYFISILRFDVVKYLVEEHQLSLIGHEFEDVIPKNMNSEKEQQVIEMIDYLIDRLRVYHTMLKPLTWRCCHAKWVNKYMRLQQLNPKDFLELISIQLLHDSFFSHSFSTVEQFLQRVEEFLKPDVLYCKLWEKKNLLLYLLLFCNENDASQVAQFVKHRERYLYQEFDSLQTIQFTISDTLFFLLLDYFNLETVDTQGNTRILKALQNGFIIPFAECKDRLVDLKSNEYNENVAYWMATKWHSSYQFDIFSWDELMQKSTRNGQSAISILLSSIETVPQAMVILVEKGVNQRDHSELLQEWSQHLVAKNALECSSMLLDHFCMDEQTRKNDLENDMPIKRRRVE